MGLLDKVGTAFKNTDSKIGQSIEESKINGKINEELHKTNKNYGALGELYYAKTEGTAENFDEDSRKICAEIRESLETIDSLKEELETVRTKAESLREANKTKPE